MGVSRALLVLATLYTLSACSGESPTPTEPPPAPLFDRIIFTREHPADVPSGYTFGLFTIRPDGTDLRVLRDNLHYPSNAAVSPDGLTVLFEDWLVLYLMDSEGRHLRPLATGLERSFLPQWSPDGRWVYFNAQVSPAAPFQIYRIRPDGTGRELLTPGPGQANSPALSRDGRYLAYVRSDSFYYPKPSWLVIRDMTTGTEETVSDSNFRGRPGNWAPDNHALLFLDSNTGYPSGWAILRFELSSHSYTFFLEPQGNRPATYSPDGRTVLFGVGDLWLADSNGLNPRIILADSMLNFEAYWTPASP